jgi:hypothetical protein
MKTIASPAFLLRPRHRLPLAAGLFVIFNLLATSLCTAQEPPRQTQEKKEEKKEEVSASPATTTGDDAAKAPPAEPQKPITLKEAVHQKKTLTEEDLHPQYGHRSREFAEPHEFNAICTPECEQRVRDQMLTDETSELEFRNKFALATQAIDDDHKWGNAVVDAVHAADDYCGLERNRAQYAYPNARPPYTTDKLNFDFINKQREVINKYVAAKGTVDISIRSMRDKDPFRAVVMQSQWDIALERSCRGVDHI